MPTVAEIQERSGEAASRCYAFTSQSMQQVRGLASRSAGYVQQKFSAFSETCRGLKDDSDGRNWSWSAPERNSQTRDSSKNEMKVC